MAEAGGARLHDGLAVDVEGGAQEGLQELEGGAADDLRVQVLQQLPQPRHLFFVPTLQNLCRARTRAPSAARGHPPNISNSHHP